MTCSWLWIIISSVLIALMIFFRYQNFRPKFIFPVQALAPWKYWSASIARYTLMICIVLLPLHLGFIAGKTIVVHKPAAVQILLDVSISMAATDMTPSRFTAAKDSLLHMIEALPGYDISLIAFSWLPFLTIPFSHDTSAITLALQKMSLADFPAATDFLGTAIGDALLLGIQNIQKLSSGSIVSPGVMLLITDGDSNKWYNPQDILPFVMKQQIPVSVLAIWDSNYLIGYDQWKEPVTTSINIPLLQNIATQTSGAFVHVLSTGDLDQFLSSFRTTLMERETTDIQPIYRYIDDVLYMLILLGLLGLGWIQLLSLLQYLKKE